MCCFENNILINFILNNIFKAWFHKTFKLQLVMNLVKIIEIVEELVKILNKL
jgi:hypothetical protein